MAMYSIQNGFAAGEVSPSLWGRTDLAKYKLGASTARNMFINYRGGLSSRAGKAYVGMCKQGAPNPGGTSTNFPPRDIPFQFNLGQGFTLEFGDLYMRIKSSGAYITEPTKAITGITNASPGVITIVAHGYSNGDWVFLTGIGDITSLNGLTWIVQNVTADTFTLTDLFGNIINTIALPAYTSGGTSARIYTLTTPYNAIDLPFLKFAQSADTMTLTLLNQVTGIEYPSYELVRNGATNWTLTQDNFGTSITSPTNVAVTATSSTALSTYYSYVVTAVSKESSEESVASAAATVQNNDIAVNAGSNTITWSAVPGASSYKIYGSIASYNVTVPIGVSYGFMGSSFGTSFTDTNITADFSTVPPVHSNPFARGAITDVTPTAGGAGYTQATIGYAITTSTGTGFAGSPIVVGGQFVGFYIQNQGENYADTDTIAITDSGAGAGGTADLVIGPHSGTYPSCVNYYQQRRAYANTKNSPNTYFMSQPGAFLNMDSGTPTIDSDAITGTPWAQQINGIQFLQPMPGGLVVLSGSGAWQVNGGNSSAITPADQTANPQAYNGCHFHIQPIVANYDILYVQSKGSIVRDLSYNFFVNIYTGTDLTILSNHLFNGHQLVQWAYAEEPYKLVWCVRDDGIMLSLTYLKEQDIYAWARHDTNGLYQGVCVITEPPSPTANVYIDAVYTIIKRYINGHWVYYSERMDNRLWQNAEDCFCVDAGLSYPMTFPDATLTPAAANGTSNITSVTITDGGEGYTSPTAIASDISGTGSGATFSVTVVGGVITAITPITTGAGYVAGRTSIIITDATGSGAVTQPVITNHVDFTTSSPVFTNANIGDVIRIGGGKATIVSYFSSTHVLANITQPITSIIPNDPNNRPIPAEANNSTNSTPGWSISTPTSTVSGLNHLEGMTVAILADGSVIPNRIVENGSIDLPQAYSQITVGLPYTCQGQTLYLDARTSEDTMQGKRKSIPAVVLRVQDSRGWSAGTNQPDASTQPNMATVPWTEMNEVKQRNASIHAGSSIPLATGDFYQEVFGDWDEKGQIAFQQTYPLPLNVLACIVMSEVGDNAGSGR